MRKVKVLITRFSLDRPFGLEENLNCIICSKGSDFTCCLSVELHREGYVPAACAADLFLTYLQSLFGPGHLAKFALVDICQEHGVHLEGMVYKMFSCLRKPIEEYVL